MYQYVLDTLLEQLRIVYYVYYLLSTRLQDLLIERDWNDQLHLDLCWSRNRLIFFHIPKLIKVTIPCLNHCSVSSAIWECCHRSHLSLFFGSSICMASSYCHFAFRPAIHEEIIVFVTGYLRKTNCSLINKSRLSSANSQ